MTIEDSAIDAVIGVSMPDLLTPDAAYKLAIKRAVAAVDKELEYVSDSQVTKSNERRVLAGVRSTLGRVKVELKMLGREGL